jgi:hypothetical protein
MFKLRFLNRFLSASASFPPLSRFFSVLLAFSMCLAVALSRRLVYNTTLFPFCQPPFSLPPFSTKYALFCVPILSLTIHLTVFQKTKKHLREADA